MTRRKTGCIRKSGFVSRTVTKENDFLCHGTWNKTHLRLRNQNTTGGKHGGMLRSYFEVLVSGLYIHIQEAAMHFISTFEKTPTKFVIPFGERRTFSWHTTNNDQSVWSVLQAEILPPTKEITLAEKSSRESCTESSTKASMRKTCIWSWNNIDHVLSTELWSKAIRTETFGAFASALI